MNIQTMRLVDRIAGVPLCALFSVLKRFLPPRENTSLRKRFLFIELSEMGSTILAYASFLALREKYPNAELHFMTFRKNRFSAELLKLFPSENIWTLSDDSIFAFGSDLLKIILKFQRMAFDAVFDMELFSRFTALLTFATRSPKRVGFHAFKMEGLYRGSLFTHPVSYNPRFHMRENFLSLVLASFENPEDRPLLKKPIPPKDIPLPRWDITPSQRQAMEQKLGKLSPLLLSKESRIVILKPSGGLLPIRAWPLEHYVTLAGKLLQHENVFLLLLGLKEETETNQALAKAVNHPRCFDLSNQTTLSEVMDLFCLAHLLIANDGGPAHFAALTPISSLVFFGPETPALYGPLGTNATPLFSRFACSPCLSAYNHRQTSCRNNLCLQVIDPESVYSSARKTLFPD